MGIFLFVIFFGSEKELVWKRLASPNRGRTSKVLLVEYIALGIRVIKSIRALETENPGVETLTFRLLVV